MRFKLFSAVGFLIALFIVGGLGAGAWRYAFIYEALPRWYPEIPLRAQQITRAEARRRILDQYLRNVIFSTVPVAARVFGWSIKETQQAVTALAEEGHLELDVKVAGVREVQMIQRL